MQRATRTLHTLSDVLIGGKLACVLTDRQLYGQVCAAPIKIDGHLGGAGVCIGVKKRHAFGLCMCMHRAEQSAHDGEGGTLEWATWCANKSLQKDPVMFDDLQGVNTAPDHLAVHPSVH